MLIDDETYLTCNQAAKLMGVSRSTVQRYCDQGILKIHRTLGGHRRIRVAEVEDWLKHRGQDQGKPARAQPAMPTAKQLVLCWIEGRRHELNLLHDQFVASKQTVETRFDSLIGVSIKELEDCHQTGRITTSQFQIACLRVRHWLKRLSLANQFLGKPNCSALGLMIGDDTTELNSLMTSVALNQSGIESVFLGQNLSPHLVLPTLQSIRPDFIWLDYRCAGNAENFIEANNSVYDAMPQSTRLIIQGDGLSADDRLRMKYDCYAESIEQHVRYCKRSSPRHDKSQIGIRRPSFIRNQAIQTS